MSTWTPHDLDEVGAADELELSTVRPDGSQSRPVTIWVVRVGDELYVRSWRGRQGRWFRAAGSHRHGHVSAGGVERDVRFEPADDAVGDDVDEAYRVKYGRYPSYVQPMLGEQARAATLRLEPHDGGDGE